MPCFVLRAVKPCLIWLLAAELTCAVDSRVTKQSRQFRDDRTSADDPCKDDSNGYNEICSKDMKKKKKKCDVSGGADNSSAVNENVERNELQQNLYESDKGKKRKSKGNRSDVSGEQARCEVVLEHVHHQVGEEGRERKIRKRKINEEDKNKIGDSVSNSVMSIMEHVHHLVGEEGRERKIRKRKSNEEDKNKIGDGVSDSVTSIKRISEYVTTRPDIPVRGSGINTETAQDNEHLIAVDTSTKSQRKRTRRHKRKHDVGDDSVEREFPAVIVNPKRETPIRSVAAPRTHIRFSDSNGDTNVDAVNDKVEACRVTSQTECERTDGGHVSSEPSSLEPLVTPTDVGAVSSESHTNLVGQPKHLSSNEQTSTKWDVQVSDTSQCGDLLCNGSFGNNHVFAKLLSFENASTPRVYQRKKNSVITDGTVQEPLSNADVETGQEVQTGDKMTDFSVYPLLKETPKEEDIIAFKVGLACIACSILFPLFCAILIENFAVNEEDRDMT
jgi:hypothetical protein